MTRPFALLLAVTLAGCGRDPVEKVEPWEMMRCTRTPPRYSIMCNGTNYIAARHWDGGYSTFGEPGYPTKAEAIADAWKHYDERWMPPLTSETSASEGANWSGSADKRVFGVVWGRRGYGYMLWP